MDPQQTVNHFIHGIGCRREHARNYNEWVNGGGFRAKVLVHGLPQEVLRLDPKRPGVVAIGIFRSRTQHLDVCSVVA